MLNIFRRRDRPGVPSTASMPRLTPDLGLSPDSSMADLVVYAEDCVVSGRLALSAERLSDVLNGQESFDLCDAMVEDVAGGPRVEVHSVAVARDEILLVHVGGPRGDPARRRHTTQHPIVAKVGPYEIRGYVHALPGADVLGSFRQRKPMIAITDAIIEFSRDSTPQSRYADVLILNRDAVEWITEGRLDAVQLPAMPVLTGVLVKDFTGDVAVGRSAR